MKSERNKLRELAKDASSGVTQYFPNIDGHTILKLLDSYERLVEALEFYADSNSWQYTDGCMQFSLHTTIVNDDTWVDPKVGEEGGIDYGGKRARQALKDAGEHEEE